MRPEQIVPTVLLFSFIAIAIIVFGCTQQLPGGQTGNGTPSGTKTQFCGDGVCQPIEASQPDICPADCPTQNKNQSGICQNACGDGICQEIVCQGTGCPCAETNSSCPQDCLDLPPQQNASTKPQKNQSGVSEENKTKVLYLGYMVHLEGWNDQMNKGQFDTHSKKIRDLADLFEQYGAKLTLESKEYTDGCIKWNDNVLKEMEDRGHGIGVHADEGGNINEGLTYPEMVHNLQVKKAKLESLNVTVRHVSGICSHLDWVNAAADAGYGFTTGQVAYCLMSMPESERPPAFKECESPSLCHETFPPELENRLTPYRAESGSDWLSASENGRLVLIPSSAGFKCVYEERNDLGYKNCVFDEDDINASITELEEAIALSEYGQVNTYYLGDSLGDAPDLVLMEKWLKAVKPFVDSGQVEWKTMPEMYDAYIDSGG
ncbi:MAG: hypothetical protein V1861_04845 [Candidatus Micrarchaeota archaeon]